MSTTENVIFYLNEGVVEGDTNLDIAFFLQEFHNLDSTILDDEIFTQMKNY